MDKVCEIPAAHHNPDWGHDEGLSFAAGRWPFSLVNHCLLAFIPSCPDIGGGAGF